MNKKDIIVFIDLGHGGLHPITRKYVTDGKESPVWGDGSQYFEGVGNREIGRLVGLLLDQHEVRYMFTVDPDNYKDVPLWKRKALINQWAAGEDKCFSISIHSNGYKEESAKGAEVWTWPGQSLSDEMATIWMEEHIKMFPELKVRSDKSDGDLDKESKFAMNGVNCYSFLIETMFHTNEKECRILMSEEGKVKIAEAIVNSILRIIKELY